MGYFLEMAVLGILIIASTAFMGTIAAKIVGIFVSKKTRDASHVQTMLIKKGFRKVGGKTK